MLRALSLHFIQVAYAAQRVLCDLVTPAFQARVSKVFSSSPGALGPTRYSFQ